MNLVIEIPDALEASVANVLIPSLKDYTYVTATNPDAFYSFEMNSGAFCQTYPMHRTGVKSKKCLRLWVNDEARKKNLTHIKNVSGYFNLHKVDYVVKYEYVEKAFRLNNGTIIPGVVMDWIEGDTLIKFVKKNFRNASVMKQLAKDFREMVDYLNRNGMAHGDLSGDNIIVTPQRRLYLIDYDSFYVKGQPDNIPQPTSGIVAYQHPARRSNRFLNTYMDYFSQQVIYLSLIAIAERPSLFKVDSDKGLVFQDMDLLSEEALQGSSAYINMATIRNQEVQDRLKDLKEDIKKPFDKVRSLTAIYEWENEKKRREEEVRNREKPQDRVVPKESKDVKRTVTSFAPFCGYCGFKFPILRDLDYYCPMCGAKRAIIS